jgi:hypothetical protein
MNFKLEKSMTSSNYYRYTFKVDNTYVDSEHFENDTWATQWYKKNKEVYVPVEISIINSYEKLRLEKRIKPVVTNRLEVKTQYVFAIWDRAELKDVDVKFTEKEHDESYEKMLSLFLQYKSEYNNPVTKVNGSEILFDENN